MQKTAVSKDSEKQDSQKKQSRVIGIFIVNTKKEMLLQKRLQHSQQSQQLWQTPYLIHHESPIAPIITAQMYVDQLGINCELQEAFTLNQSKQQTTTQPNKGEHIIIAVVKELSTEKNQISSETYRWIPINRVLQDIHENPQNYALWFKSTLEGVDLYLTNHIKNIKNK